MSIRKKIFSGLKWTTLSTVVVALAAILKLSILARILDKSDFGLMALVVSVIGMMHMINDLGLGAALLHKKNIRIEEYSSVYWFNWLVSVGMFLFMLLLAPMVAGFYGQVELQELLPLAGLALLFSGFGFHFKIIEQKNLRFQTIAIIEIVGSLLSFASAIVLAYLGFGVYALLYSLLLQTLFANLAFMIIGWRRVGIKFYFSWREARPFLKIGSYQVGGQIFNIFNKELDILLIGYFMTAEVLGLYSLAKQLVQKPIAIIMPVVVRVGSPALASINDQADRLKGYFLRIVNMVSSFSYAIYIVLFIFADMLIGIIYGEEYMEMTLTFRILCIYMMLRSPMAPIGVLTTATGKTYLEFRWNFLTLLVTPIFLYIGVGYGIEGVAMALLVNIAVLFVPFWAMMVRGNSDIGLGEYSRAVFLVFRGWR